MSPTVALRCAGLARSFGAGSDVVRVLDGVDLEVAAGELVVLRGPSGSGKTTLLNLLGGLDVPTAGEVWLEGDRLDHRDEESLARLRRHRIGFVFQSFALLPVLTAAENLDLPLRIAGRPAPERAERVRELLAEVGLAAHAAQRPEQLSGGQQQRLGIARALANRPAVLLADEPTGQLDTATGAAMMSLLHGLVHDHGVAALVSTHDPRVAERADRVVELRAGRVVAGG